MDSISKQLCTVSLDTLPKQSIKQTDIQPRVDCFGDIISMMSFFIQNYIAVKAIRNGWNSMKIDFVWARKFLKWKSFTMKHRYLVLRFRLKMFLQEKVTSCCRQCKKILKFILKNHKCQACEMFGQSFKWNVDRN